MKKSVPFAHALAALCGLALTVNMSSAGPGTHDPGVNKRQHWQHHRIRAGAKSGALTPRETARLKAEERALRREEWRYKADGKLTPAERKDLQQDLNKISKDIYQQKHDDQKRP